MPVVGFLHFGLSREFAYQVPLFQRGLAQQGYVEGRNVATEVRWAEGQYERLPALAADLVGRKVDVIFAAGSPSAMAAAAPQRRGNRAGSRHPPLSLAAQRQDRPLNRQRSALGRTSR
jgi:hypothetical protein